MPRRLNEDSKAFVHSLGSKCTDHECGRISYESGWIDCFNMVRYGYEKGFEFKDVIWFLKRHVQDLDVLPEDED